MSLDSLPMLERHLLESVAGLGLDQVEARIECSGDRVRIMFRLDAEALSSGAWGLIYAIGRLSFSSAARESDGAASWREDDHWTAEDMLSHLLFENSRLYFFARCVRGRCINTIVEVDSDGDVTIETVERGEAVSRWLVQLQGKTLVTVVSL